MNDMELLQEIYRGEIAFVMLSTALMYGTSVYYNTKKKKAAATQAKRAEELNKYNFIVADIEPQKLKQYNFIVEDIEPQNVIKKGEKLGEYNFIVADIEPADKDTKEQYNITIA